MKKRYIILPAVGILISVCLAFILTSKASPFVYYNTANFSSNAPGLQEKYEKNFYKTYRKVEEAYRLSPNESTLNVLVEISNPTIKAFEQFDSYVFPDDFYQKCEVYNREMINYLDAHPGVNPYNGPYNVSKFDAAYGNEWALVTKYNCLMNVAYSQLMQGKTDEAKNNVEIFISDYKEILKKPDCTQNEAFLGRRSPVAFFIYTGALIDDPDYQKWLTEKKEEISALFNEYVKSHPDELFSPELKDNYFKSVSYEELEKVYKTGEAFIYTE